MSIFAHFVRFLFIAVASAALCWIAGQEFENYMQIKAVFLSKMWDFMTSSLKLNFAILFIVCRLPENTPASQALQLSIEAHTGTCINSMHSDTRLLWTYISVIML